MQNSLTLYIIIFFISFTMLFVGLIALFFQYRNKQKLLAKEKELMLQQHEQALLSTQLEIQQATMQQIGEEIHDSVGQKLTLASLYSQKIDFDNNFPEFKQSMHEIATIINESLDELRAISKNLTTNSFTQHTLEELLNNEVSKLIRLGKCSIQFINHSKQTIHLQNQTKLILIRAVQESITNCLKHSNCNNITLQLRVNNTLLELSVEDDGIGFIESEITKHVGLKSMQHRIVLLGGKMEIQTQKNSGTKISFRLNVENL